MTTQELEIKAKAAKKAFLALFDASGNKTPMTHADPAKYELLCAESSAADKAWRDSVAADHSGIAGDTVEARNERERIKTQTAARKSLAEKDARRPVFAKSQAQLDAEYDAELNRNQD